MERFHARQIFNDDVKNAFHQSKNRKMQLILEAAIYFQRYTVISYFSHCSVSICSLDMNIFNITCQSTVSKAGGDF